jgi:hypothetical protein
MRFRSTVLLILVAAIGLFCALNWTALTAPATLSFLVMSVQAPIGLVMLGFMLLLGVAFLLALLYLQSSVLVSARRHASQLQAQRDLADKAEVSRIVELRQYLGEELPKLEQSLLASLAEAENALAAHIGQLEDRIERGGSQVVAERPG